MKTANAIMGMAAAAMVGAAIGMLLAPEKGSELQRKLKDVAGSALDDIAKLIGTGKQVASEARVAAEQEMASMRSNLERIDEN